jgi:hypothetical protein
MAKAAELSKKQIDQQLTKLTDWKRKIDALAPTSKSG